MRIPPVRRATKVSWLQEPYKSRNCRSEVSSELLPLKRLPRDQTLSLLLSYCSTEPAPHFLELDRNLRLRRVGKCGNAHLTTVLAVTLAPDRGVLAECVAHALWAIASYGICSPSSLQIEHITGSGFLQTSDTQGC